MRLQSYPWPGNVRELAHELERSLVLGDGGIVDFSRLPAPSGEDRSVPAEGVDAGEGDWMRRGFIFPDSGFDLEEAIDRLVALALEQTGGNVSAAARLLGVKRDYVRYRLSRIASG